MTQPLRRSQSSFAPRLLDRVLTACGRANREETRTMTLDRDSLGSLTVVDVPERCGNAPRKAVVRDFTVALVSKNVAEVLQHISADARWTLNGKQPLHGADEISAWVAGGPEAQELEIHTVITHGTECG